MAPAARFAQFAHRVAGRAARGYIAGPKLDDALRAAGTAGVPVTLGYWDASGEDPTVIANHHLAAIAALAVGSIQGYVSAKLPPLGGGDLVDRVAESARRAGLLLHFDSLDESSAEEMVALSLRLARSAQIGASVPGGWSRSVEDASALANAGVRVRVVKGQWPGDRDPRGGFLDVTRAVAAVRAPAAIATHDPELADEALGICRGLDVELELLYGLPLGPAARVAKAHRVPVRLYIPYGTGYLPYAWAQVRRRPQILWWLARDAVLRTERAGLESTVQAG